MLEDRRAEASHNVPRSGRIAMPSDWCETLGANFRGRVRYVRRFNRPTGLAPGQRVDLVIDGVDACGRVLLNDRLLLEIPPGGNAASIDVGPLLEEHNRLAIEVELPAVSASNPPVRPSGRDHLPGGLYGEVRLEIHT